MELFKDWSEGKKSAFWTIVIFGIVLNLFRIDYSYVVEAIVQILGGVIGMFVFTYLFFWLFNVKMEDK